MIFRLFDRLLAEETPEQENPSLATNPIETELTTMRLRRYARRTGGLTLAAAALTWGSYTAVQGYHKLQTPIDHTRSMESDNHETGKGQLEIAIPVDLVGIGILAAVGRSILHSAPNHTPRPTTPPESQP